jgi:hypothetical protein
MSANTPELEAALTQALALTPLEKVRLVEQVMATLENDLLQQDKKQKRSLYGLWSDVSVSAEDIDEARSEMWSNFPREDI